jgi:hypothetical protein
MGRRRKMEMPREPEPEPELWGLWTKDAEREGWSFTSPGVAWTGTEAEARRFADPEQANHEPGVTYEARRIELGEPTYSVTPIGHLALKLASVARANRILRRLRKQP